MSVARNTKLRSFVCGVSVGVVAACSLQMPNEAEVFGRDDGAHVDSSAGGGTNGAAESGGAIGAGAGAKSGTAGVASASGGERQDASSNVGGGTSGAVSGGSIDAGAGGTESGSAGTISSFAEGSGGDGQEGGATSETRAGSPGVAGDAGLVAHYTFDAVDSASIADRLDAQKKGRCFGTCNRATGRRGGAVGLRNQGATVDYIVLPEGLLSELTETTISVWVRDLSTAREGGRLFHFSRGNAEEIFFAPHDVHPETSLPSSHLGGSHLGVRFVDIWSNGPDLTDKVWHHVAITWSVERIELYLDGVSRGAGSKPGARPSDLGVTAPNYLGCTLNDAAIAVYAEIDELRIYDRVLALSEITALFEDP